MTGAYVDLSDSGRRDAVPATLPAASTAAKPKPWVVIYGREASDAPATADFLEAQRIACQRLVEQLGPPLVDVFIGPEHLATSTSAR